LLITRQRHNRYLLAYSLNTRHHRTFSSLCRVGCSKHVPQKYMRRYTYGQFFGGADRQLCPRLQAPLPYFFAAYQIQRTCLLLTTVMQRAKCCFEHFALAVLVDVNLTTLLSFRPYKGFGTATNYLPSITQAFP
jgi:hypothetical protein